MSETVYALCFYIDGMPYQLQASTNKERLERTKKRQMERSLHDKWEIKPIHEFDKERADDER